MIDECLKNKDVERLLIEFRKVLENYGCYSKVEDYVNLWTSEAYIYLEEYDKAWEFYRKQPRIDINYFLSYKKRCKDISIDGTDLLRLSDSSYLTDFGKKHRDQIANIATIILKDFKEEHKYSFVDYFTNDSIFTDISKDAFSSLRKFFIDEKEFNIYRDMCIGANKSYPCSYERYLFSGVPRNGLPKVECEEYPVVIAVALKNEIKRILRECENTVRDEYQLPKVGEGWISESELYYKIRTEFADEKVIHQGRPSWLSPQHLDIYFPLKNIGIEYQGKQHSEPVEYFGGVKAFNKRKKLDQRKKMLCTKNNCKLILVYEGYNFDDLKIEISRYIQ